jgi:tRNA (cytidine/uridine-2'-O-)-methyltransferase
VHVVLVAPEIHMNTGNVIRLCANTGSTLHLVEPLGFSMDSAALKRAGLDYHDLAEVHVHKSFESLNEVLGASTRYAFSSRGKTRYDTVTFQPDDVLVFGAERAGLPEILLAHFDAAHLLTLPMRPNNRSLNLANSVAVVVFEAWRQQDFYGAASTIERGLTTEHLSLPAFDS